MDTFEHVVQAEFDEVFKKDYKLKGKWATDFFKNNNPIVIIPIIAKISKLVILFS